MGNSRLFEIFKIIVFIILPTYFIFKLNLPMENRIGLFCIYGLFAAPFIDDIKL